jgi:hypothetical protein
MLRYYKKGRPLLTNITDHKTKLRETGSEGVNNSSSLTLPMLNAFKEAFH